MTIDTIPSPAVQSASRLATLVSGWSAFIRHLRGWSSCSRSRQSLANLTEDQLRDIGLSEHEARREAGKSLMVRLDRACLPPL
ncbi:hypothetical protein ASC71_09195 [Rhizobium sp. Root1240]|nr:DUF1127 domain-containing protein [Rhizobium sp. Root1240]KQW28663.1 hypothetical protein ASC71_09195 [Rhizobium sp. Root1240]